MLSLLRRPLERFPIRTTERLQLLPSFVRNLFSQPTLLFDDRISHISHLLKTHDETSNEVTSALKELETFYPRPPVQLIPKGVWPKESTNRITVQTHLKSTFADAINLLNATGRTLSPEDDKYLRLLLTHSCGWSATYPEEMNDPWWADFFPVRYPHLKGLVPILDSMTYLPELVEFPDEYHFQPPQFILLATPNAFFVYDTTDGEDGLRAAGKTLEDMYNGLKDWRWADSSEDPWDLVEEGDYVDPAFPCYYRKANGNFGAWSWGEFTCREYPGSAARRGLVHRLFDLVLTSFKR